MEVDDSHFSLVDSPETNGVDGISDIEHVAIGHRAGRRQRSLVAGASTGSASDQGKVARVAMSKWSSDRVSISASEG